MKRMLCYFAGYLGICVCLYNRKAFNIFALRGGKVIGIVIGAVLTLLLIYLTFDYIKSENSKHILEITDTSVNEKRTTIADWLLFYQDLEYKPYNVANSLIDEVSDTVKVADLLNRTIEDIMLLLKSNFSESDLTYITYKDSIEEIVQTCCANFASIARRMSVYKKDWSTEHTLGVTYEKEIRTFLKYNTEIGHKMEELTHELVQMSDSKQQCDTVKLTELITQAKNYVNVRQES